VAARLLDVGPDGQETLISRGLWRPAVSATPRRQVFQLHPGGWRFAAGHTAKLELLPNDVPYGRASNGQQNVTVSKLQLRLPTVSRPGGGGGLVHAPLPKVLPPGDTLAREFAPTR
jgi:predicted acyl esterase